MPDSVPLETEEGRLTEEGWRVFDALPRAVKQAAWELPYKMAAILDYAGRYRGPKRRGPRW